MTWTGQRDLALYFHAIGIVDDVMAGERRSDDPLAVAAAKCVVEMGFGVGDQQVYGRCVFDIIAEAHGFAHPGTAYEPDASSDEDYTEGVWPI